MSNPWLKFYPSDWASDPKLGLCSLQARGFWMELLCLMHEAEPRGSLLVNGKAPTARQIAILARCTVDEAMASLTELEEAGVIGRDEGGVIISRRIKRDTEKAEQDKLNGRKGGNPKLTRTKHSNDNPGVNPPHNPDDKGGLKAQKPEARSSVPSGTGASAPVPADPSIAERDLFQRGREVLGPKAGGVIANLLRSKGGNPSLARAAIEEASQRSNPMEFVMGAIRHTKGNRNGKSDLIDAADDLVEYLSRQHPPLLAIGGG